MDGGELFNLFYLALPEILLFARRQRSSQKFVVVDTNGFFDKIQKLLMDIGLIQRKRSKPGNCQITWNEVNWKLRMIAEVQTSFSSRGWSTLCRACYTKMHFLNRITFWRFEKASMRIRGPFCALIQTGPRPFRAEPKTDKNENVITVQEIDGSSDLTVYRINNLQWLQKGMKLSKFRFKN